jgi:hypothetical protein
MLVKQNQFKETRLLVGETKTAHGYALANGKLPYARLDERIQTVAGLTAICMGDLGHQGGRSLCRPRYYAVKRIWPPVRSSLTQLRSNLEPLLNGTTTPDSTATM